MIQTYSIETGMGKCFEKLPFLTEVEMDNFNNIGYASETLDGVKMSRTQYLNSLDKGEFHIDQTKFDDGSFVERFTIVRVTTDKTPA